MTTQTIRINPLFTELKNPGILGSALRLRIQKQTGKSDRVEIDFPTKVEMNADTFLEVRVARKEAIEGYTAETFARYVGFELQERLRNVLPDKQIVVTVIIGRGTPGVWKRHP